MQGQEKVFERIHTAKRKSFLKDHGQEKEQHSKKNSSKEKKVLARNK
jgi:hypothetical protein